MAKKWPPSMQVGNFAPRRVIDILCPLVPSNRAAVIACHLDTANGSAQFLVYTGPAAVAVWAACLRRHRTTAANCRYRAVMPRLPDPDDRAAVVVAHIDFITVVQAR